GEVEPAEVVAVVEAVMAGIGRAGHPAPGAVAVPDVKGEPPGGAHDRLGVTGDEDGLDDMETPAPGWATVGVDGYGGVGVGGVADGRPVGYARAYAVVVRPGHHDAGPGQLQECPQPQGDVQVEGRLAVARRRLGAARVTRLAKGHGVDDPVDLGGVAGVATVVAGVDDDGSSGESASRPGRGRRRGRARNLRRGGHGADLGAG